MWMVQTRSLLSLKSQIHLALANGTYTMQLAFFYSRWKKSNNSYAQEMMLF